MLAINNIASSSTRYWLSHFNHTLYEVYTAVFAVHGHANDKTDIHECMQQKKTQAFVALVVHTCFL